MNIDNKEAANTCHDGLCTSCAVGMCGVGCGHHHHKHFLKILVKLILLIFVCSVAFKMGEVKGLLERSHMYKQYGDYRGGMMSQFKYVGNNLPPIQNGSSTTPTPATPTPSEK